MNRNVMKFIVFLLLTLLLMLCACKDNNDESKQKTYTIQYSDDSGLYSIYVEKGELYSLSTIPSRIGYDFIGLFDAEIGGTQYINSTGGSLSAFSDNRNLVLYAQYKAKEYTVILDYHGAEVNGSRSLSVSYGQMLSNLPTNLTMKNKIFVGWFTEPDMKGVQIADQYGVLPAKAKVNENNYDLSDPDGYITLYAGFKGEEHLVTFYVDGVRDPEEHMIEHDTYISKVVTELRNADGMAVLSWSKFSDKSEIFEGKIQNDMVLYSVEFAPVLDFEVNGGFSVESIIARKGAEITLPTPVRENYTFAGWYTTAGKEFTATTMPGSSENLVAHWNAKLIFNTNGGTAVKDISEAVGTKISLPSTKKSGYIFAGWYTDQGQKYDITSMPETSVKLFAKYYKTQSKRYSLISASYEAYIYTDVPIITKGNTKQSVVLDLSELYDVGVQQVEVTANYKGWFKSFKAQQKDNGIYMVWYNQGIPSDGYNVWSYGDKISFRDTSKYTFEHSTSLSLTTPKYYICYYTTEYSGSSPGRIQDFWVEISYPDTSVLY